MTKPDTETAGEPKRYDWIVTNGPPDCPRYEPVERANGFWVKYEDSAALQSRIDAKEALNIELLKELSALVIDYGTLRDENAELRAKADAEMLRVKACEHIADGDGDWEKLRNECPSTAAVSRLRDSLAQARDEALMARDTLIQLQLASSEMTRIAFDATPITDPECMRVWMEWEAAQKASTDLIVASVKSPKSAEGEPG